MPTTCATLGTGACGSQSNGCGGVLDCGPCGPDAGPRDAAADARGDEDAPSDAGPDATCYTCDQIPFLCGQILNGCGKLIECTCNTGQTCAMTPGAKGGVCCTPLITCSFFPPPEAGVCATHYDNCLNVLHCGDCPADAGGG
jgi:hypothetical protein